MENTTAVGRQALRYRIVINEGIGIIITLAATALVGIALYIIKLKDAALIDIAVFLCVFVLQLIVLYFISLMQYKNLRYNIGQNAISFQRGVFGVERETIPFEKVKNSTFDQTFIQRFFSVGDITIEQDDEEYIWENIDSNTATLISNAVSAKGDVQPITVSTAVAAVSAPPQTPNQPTQTETPSQPTA
jgi:uncharacterized membrane protein YdbT with pleckstrin-like domain